MTETSPWGLCMNCAWWRIEPDAVLASATHGMCVERRLQAHRLRVSGGSGCGLFAGGDPARVDGASACPPVAAPS